MDQQIVNQLISQIASLEATVEGLRSGWFIIGASAITGVIGFLAALIPTTWIENRRAQREARAIRSALHAEVSAIAEIIRSRQYIEELKKGAAGEYQYLSVNVPADYFVVYKSNTAMLGLLDPTEAEQIVRFYHLIESVVQDVTPGGSLATGKGDRENFRVDAEFLEKAIEMADDLLSKGGAKPGAK